jgi:hypothetical protein
MGMSSEQVAKLQPDKNKNKTAMMMMMMMMMMFFYHSELFPYTTQ